jgi:hypothetical protein
MPKHVYAKAEQYCLCETRHKTQEQQVKQIAIHSGKNTKLFPLKNFYICCK